jgi:hypothetical protein
MPLTEVCMFGACANDAVQTVHDLIVSLIVTSREACKQREIALIAGTGRDEIRLYLRCDLSQVRARLDNRTALQG